MAIHHAPSLRDLTKSSRGNPFSASIVFDFGLLKKLRYACFATLAFLARNDELDEIFDCHDLLYKK
ncbi:hypothetical protein CQA40_09310 [Helicobacter sp. MIT 01-3238]|nr:hypothetical protein CQA40_09310 [Helicobacter sp. MIT 01-3238]